MVNVLVVETDDGGKLEVSPNSATGGAMLRILPAKGRSAYAIDSVGFFKLRDDDLRVLAKEILRVTKKRKVR